MIRETERRGHAVGFFLAVALDTLAEAGSETGPLRHFLEAVAQDPVLQARLVFQLGQADLRAGGEALAVALHHLARLGFRFGLERVDDPAGLEVGALALHAVRYLTMACDLLLDGGPAIDALLAECRDHGVDLIAEGVDTAEQRSALLDLGVSYGQGSLFGEPRPSRRPS